MSSLLDEAIVDAKALREAVLNLNKQLEMCNTHSDEEVGEKTVNSDENDNQNYM